MYLIFTQCKSNGTGQICTQWEYNQDIFETTVVTQFDLVCDRKQWLPTIASSYMCGVSIAILKKLLNYFESALKLKNSVVLNAQKNITAGGFKKPLKLRIFHCSLFSHVYLIL